MDTPEARVEVEEELKDLARIAPVISHEVLDRTLSLVRDHLDLDLVLLTEIVEDKEVVLEAEGDEAALQDVVETEGDQIILLDEDEQGGPGTEEGHSCILDVPLTFSDGRVFGTLCCVGHEHREIDDHERRFVKILGRLVSDQLEREELQKRNNQLFLEQTALEVLMAALGARDGYTGEHSEEVVELSLAVADEMQLSGRTRDLVKQTALLHDVGKIGIPDQILRKKGPLDEAEWVVMKSHPEIGQRIVESTYTLRHLGLAIRAEHERWDGEGYPDGLRGEEIPLPSRIVFVCDAYHAMVSDRPYRPAMRRGDALARLLAASGTQFDPKCVEALYGIVSRQDENGFVAEEEDEDDQIVGDGGMKRSSLVSLLADIQEATMSSRNKTVGRSEVLRREIDEVLHRLETNG